MSMKVDKVDKLLIVFPLSKAGYTSQSWLHHIELGVKKNHEPQFLEIWMKENLFVQE